MLNFVFELWKCVGFSVLVMMMVLLVIDLSILLVCIIEFVLWVISMWWVGWVVMVVWISLWLLLVMCNEFLCRIGIMLKWKVMFSLCRIILIWGLLIW